MPTPTSDSRVSDNPPSLQEGNQDDELLSYLLRHTTLLRPTSPKQRVPNRDIQVGVLSKEVAERDYDLSDLRRLREWREPSQGKVASRSQI